MSFTTDIANYSYAVPPLHCDLCNDANKTPATLFLCFSNIQQGNNWIPADPPPPNGVVEVPLTALCRYDDTVGLYDYRYVMVAGKTLCFAQVTGAMNAFYFLLIPTCQLSFDNQIINPVGNKYYGGSCQVVPPLEGGIWSVPELLALMSDDPHWADWLNPIPMTNEQTVYKLYKGHSQVNIKIKIDHS